MLKYGFSPDCIYRLASAAFEGAYSRLEILQWLEVFYRRFFSSQFKRSCSADGPGLFDIGLSPRGMLVMPSDASGISWTADVRILIQMEQQRLADN